MIPFLHLSQNDHHNKSTFIIIHSNRIFFLWVSSMQNSIINYCCHAIYYIPMNYLFCTWKFEPFDSLYPFLSPLNPHPQPLGTPSMFYISACFVLFCFIFFCFLDSTYKWDPMVCVLYFGFNLLSDI